MTEATQRRTRTNRPTTSDVLAARPQAGETVEFSVDESDARLVREALDALAAESGAEETAAAARAFRAYFGTVLQRLVDGQRDAVTVSLDAADVALLVRAAVDTDATATGDDDRLVALGRSLLAALGDHRRELVDELA
jgi:hypothetical protein